MDIVYDAGVTRVLFIVQSDIFDLTAGDSFTRPNADMVFDHVHPPRSHFTLMVTASMPYLRENMQQIRISSACLPLRQFTEAIKRAVKSAESACGHQRIA